MDHQSNALLVWFMLENLLLGFPGCHQWVHQTQPQQQASHSSWQCVCLWSWRHSWNQDCSRPDIRQETTALADTKHTWKWVNFPVTCKCSNFWATVCSLMWDTQQTTTCQTLTVTTTATRPTRNLQCDIRNVSGFNKSTVAEATASLVSASEIVLWVSV